MNKIIEKIFNVIIPTFFVTTIGIISCLSSLSLYLTVLLIILSSLISIPVCNHLCKSVINKEHIINDVIEENEPVINENKRNIIYHNIDNISKNKSKVRIKKKN